MRQINLKCTPNDNNIHIEQTHRFTIESIYTRAKQPLFLSHLFTVGPIRHLVPVANSDYRKTNEDTLHDANQNEHQGQGAQIVRVFGACRITHSQPDTLNLCLRTQLNNKMFSSHSTYTDF